MKNNAFLKVFDEKKNKKIEFDRPENEEIKNKFTTEEFVKLIYTM